MHSTAPGPEIDPQDDTRTDLSCGSFVALLTAAGMGALNDNIFRALAIGVGKTLVSKEWENGIAALAMALFVIPFLICVAPAGYFADRFSKRHVLIGVKFAEVLLVLGGGLALYLGSLPLFMGILFLMGIHAAIYAPVKYGSLPELFRSDCLPAANGILALVTYLAIIFGAVLGNWLAAGINHARSAGTHDGLLLAVGTMLGVALAGLIAASLLRRLKPADAVRRLPRPSEWVGETAKDLTHLWQAKELRYTALAIAFFWSLGSMTQLVIDDFGLNVLRLDRSQIGYLQAVLAIGIGLGSFLVGWLSSGRIELGMVPIGALGLALSGTALGIWGNSQDAFAFSVVGLACLGMAGGLYEVPLAAWLQYRSPPKELGSILAANNFLTYVGVLAFTGLFYLLSTALRLPANLIFLACGLLSAVVLVVTLRALPYETLRAIFRLLALPIYRIGVRHADLIPPTGGVVLVPNHVSYMDAILVGLACPRPVRMMAWAGNFKSGLMTWLARATGTILIEVDKGPRAILRALQDAKKAVEAGEVVCIFPEGQLTRTAQVQPFQRGVTRLVEGNDVPIVPVWIDQMWGSIFSFERGKFFWKWPRQLPYRASVDFGDPVARRNDPTALRQAVLHLGEQAAEKRKETAMLLPRQFVRQCRRSLFRPKVADSIGTELTGGKLLAGAMVLAKLLRRHVLAADEPMVGVLLPPSVGGVVTNAALALLRRTAINLNYTVSAGVMNSCIRQCGMKHVLTSRKVYEKLGLKLDVEVVFLEDLKPKATLFDKALAAFQTFALPAGLIEMLWSLGKIKPEDPLTVVFTSGSTGEPKGVVLSQYNIAANVESMQQLVNLSKTDCVLGLLPFFHSFGYTCTLWTVLSLDPKGAYHFSPLDARQVGELCHKHKATFLLSTPTFLRNYLRRCEPEQFATLEMILAGAEKVPGELAKAFREKFGKDIYEGYGTTELSPLVSVNIPDHRSPAVHQKGSKPGTVGRPIPGVATRVVDPDSGKELGTNEPGMLYVRGPNLMQGYLNRPDLTAEKVKDGWYETGDVAFVDDEGFITITGRLSRFSKIGGEMVPHIRIEEELVLAAEAGQDELKLVVTAVPDEKKGERLIVLHTKLEKTSAELCKALSVAGLPNLWIPGNDSFFLVEEIPVLGTGKVALAEVKELAKKLVGG